METAPTWLITANLRSTTCTSASTASCRAAFRMARRAAIGPLHPAARQRGAREESCLESCKGRDRTCSHESPRVEHEHAAARVAEGKLDRRKPFGCVVRVRAARADRVQVERQLDPAARHRHRLGERDDVHEARHEVQHVLVVGQRQVVGEARALEEPLVARVDDQCALALALARRAAVLDNGAHPRLQVGAEGGRLGGVGRHLVGHPNLVSHALPLALHVV